MWHKKLAYTQTAVALALLCVSIGIVFSHRPSEAVLPPAAEVRNVRLLTPSVEPHGLLRIAVEARRTRLCPQDIEQTWTDAVTGAAVLYNRQTGARQAVGDWIERELVEPDPLAIPPGEYLYRRTILNHCGGKTEGFVVADNLRVTVAP